MTHYLLEVGYTPQSWSGQIDSEADVVERITPALETCGASIVSIHYTFGDHDLVAICDFPSPEDAAAFGLAVTSSGALRSYRTTPLLSVEQGIESMRRAAELRKVYTPPTVATAGESTNTALLRAGYAAFATGDLDTVMGMFDPSIIWHTPETISFGGTYVGPAAVGDFFGKLVEHYAELHVDPDQYLEQGETVAVLGHLRGRTAAGNEFNTPFVHVWRVVDGKATSFTEHFDTAKMNAALGAGVGASSAR